MPKTPKKRDEYHDAKTSISDEMKKRQNKRAPGAPVPNQIIEVKSADYRRLKSVVDSQLRRKLAGEFPYNAIGREVNVSTSTFWMEIMITHLRAYWVHMSYSEDMIPKFIESVGDHPTHWGVFHTVDQLELVIDEFVEMHSPFGLSPE